MLYNIDEIHYLLNESKNQKLFIIKAKGSTNLFTHLFICIYTFILSPSSPHVTYLIALVI